MLSGMPGGRPGGQRGQHRGYVSLLVILLASSPHAHDIKLLITARVGAAGGFEP